MEQSGGRLPVDVAILGRDSNGPQPIRPQGGECSRAPKRHETALTSSIWCFVESYRQGTQPGCHFRHQRFGAVDAQTCRLHRTQATSEPPPHPERFIPESGTPLSRPISSTISSRRSMRTSLTPHRNARRIASLDTHPQPGAPRTAPTSDRRARHPARTARAPKRQPRHRGSTGPSTTEPSRRFFVRQRITLAGGFDNESTGSTAAHCATGAQDSGG